MWFDELEVPDDPGPKQLQLFVEGVERFLIDVVLERGEAEFAILWLDRKNVASDGSRALLHAAARESLEKDVRPALAELRAAVARLDPEVAASHGLDGSALRFKLLVVQAVTRRWASEHRGGKRTTPGWFRKLVDVIDAVLDSVIDATGHGGLIKEFKDALGALA